MLLREKSNGTSVTIRLNAVVRDFPPPVPVITKGKVPVEVELLVVTVKVEVQEGPQAGIEKDAFAPLGSPEIEKETD